MKAFFRNIHLYLSLASGIVILIACFTGAILVFEDELQHAFNKGRYYVSPAGPALPADALLQKVRQEVPEAKIASVKVYADAGRSVEIGVMLPQKEEGKKALEKKEAPALKDNLQRAKSGAPEGKTTIAKPNAKGQKGEKAKGGGRPTHTIFVNQYTGDILEVYSYRETFFFQVFALHRWLLGSNDGIGKYIVGWSTFMFLFILITGIVLWWPKTGKVLKQRLTVKWDASWKRLNHDFHIVFGFYSAIFLFIFAFTGLSWSFKWFNEGVTSALGADAKRPDAPESVYEPGVKQLPLYQVLQIAAQNPSEEYSYAVQLPKDSVGVFTVNVQQAGVNESAVDTYFIDQYSGIVASSALYSDKTAGQKVRGAFKAIHISSIFGLPSKIIGFIVCLLGVTFPVTGLILWLKRLKKENKKKSKKKLQVQ